MPSDPRTLSRPSGPTAFAASILRKIRRRFTAPLVGHVDMGDLAQIAPISSAFGFDRGTPVDRYYVEAFLEKHAAHVHGRVLEFGDDQYSAKFGRDIAKQDVVNLEAGVPGTTIAADIAQAGALPAGAFDAIVCTQVIHLIYDMPAAAAELYRALTPGGMLLTTVPGISPVDPLVWEGEWNWSLTAQSATRLFGDAFGSEAISVEVFGNAFAATCLLQGIVQQDIDCGWLDPYDKHYPVIIAVAARKPL